MATASNENEKPLRFSFNNVHYNMYEHSQRFTKQETFFDTLTPEQDISALIYIDAAMRAEEFALAEKANEIIKLRAEKYQGGHC